jgi:hypothetical protein
MQEKQYHIVITLVKLSIFLMLFRKVWHLVFIFLIGWLFISGFSCSYANAQTSCGMTYIEGQVYKILDTDHFSLVYSPDIKDDEKIASILELAYCHFQTLFTDSSFEPVTPAEKLRWITFTDKDSFNLYALNTENQDLSWLNGYYSAKTNVVAVVSPQKISKWQIQSENEHNSNIIACPPDAETGLAKIVHEAAHQLAFNTELQKRKLMYPFWVSEGLATYFEQSMFSAYFESSRYSSIRKKGLIKACSQKKLIPLDRFISMTSLNETVSAVDAYAQAWGFFTFLIENNKNSLKTYLSRLYKLEPAWIDEQTLHNVFIESFGYPSDLNSQWVHFVEQLP